MTQVEVAQRGQRGFGRLLLVDLLEEVFAVPHDRAAGDEDRRGATTTQLRPRDRGDHDRDPGREQGVGDGKSRPQPVRRGT